MQAEPCRARHRTHDEEKGGRVIEYLKVDEYAAMMKKHPQHVRDMCKRGEIDAVKVGKTWRIPYVEPPDVLAEEKVQEAVDGLLAPCAAVIDAAMDALLQMKAQLLRAKGEIDGSSEQRKGGGAQV